MSRVEELQEQLDNIQQEIARLTKGQDESDQPQEGQWVWVCDAEYLLYWEGTNGVMVLGYGFNFSPPGPWRPPGTSWCDINQIDRPATEQEVREALIRESKRRGIVPGARVRCLDDDKAYTIEDFNLSGSIDLADNKMWARPKKGWGVQIFKEGEWAEVLPEEEPITINGHEVEFTDSGVIVGCRSIDQMAFKRLTHYANRHGITIHRNCEDITPQIKKIAERIKQCS